MNVFNLNNMITPKILTGIYVLTTVIAAVACVLTFLGGSFTGAIAWGLIAFFNRIFFECIIVVFKNNEYLRRIANALDGGGEPDVMADILRRNGRKTYESGSDWENYKKSNDPQDKQ